MTQRYGHILWSLLGCFLLASCMPVHALAGSASTPPTEGPARSTRPSPWGGTVQAFANPNVTIVESRSFLSGHEQDLRWSEAATAIGLQPTIVAQSALDDVANLSGTGVLVVSSGVITLTPARAATIVQFLESGRAVYLQGEYLCDYSTNVLFGDIVNTHGGSYTALGTWSGDLQPMQISGTLAHDPNVVPFLDFFWYGCAGSGDSTIEGFLTSQGHAFGHVFRAPGGTFGKLITTSDQDWILEANVFPRSFSLMQNILVSLAYPAPVPVSERSWGGLKRIYR